jgi:hypothetical protein
LFCDREAYLRRRGCWHRPGVWKHLRAHFVAGDGPVDAIAWGMATTGMGAKEYWGTWSVRSDRVHIDGKKTAAQLRDTRVRDVPLIIAPRVPTRHRRTFDDKLRDRTKRAITHYDLRRTYLHALETAKIMRSRRRMYMGHGVDDTTRLYERHEVDAFLAADGATLRDFFGVTELQRSTLYEEDRDDVPRFLTRWGPDAR